MNTLAFDTLKFAQTLEQAGMENKQAEAMAAAQREVFNQLAEEQKETQEKLVQMQTEVKWSKESFASQGQLKQVQDSQDNLATKADIAELKTETKADIAELKAAQENFATKSDLARVEARMEAGFGLMKWMIGIVVSINGIVLSALIALLIKLYF